MQDVLYKNISHEILSVQSQVRSVKGIIRTLSDSIEGILAEGLSDFGRKPCKLCHTRGDSLPQAVFTFPACIHHRFFCNQDCLVVRFPHHIVNEDGHTFARPPFSESFEWLRTDLACLNVASGNCCELPGTMFGTRFSSF